MAALAQSVTLGQRGDSGGSLVLALVAALAAAAVVSVQHRYGSGAWRQLGGSPLAALVSRRQLGSGGVSVAAVGGAWWRRL